jgi:hypothetical protein
MVGAARVAETSQAAYFRGVLADERDQVARDLLRSRVQLRACVEGEKVVGLRTMARMRSEVRAFEAKQRELDRLIAALDRRFSAVWIREG